MFLTPQFRVVQMYPKMSLLLPNCFRYYRTCWYYNKHRCHGILHHINWSLFKIIKTLSVGEFIIYSLCIFIIKIIFICILPGHCLRPAILDRVNTNSVQTNFFRKSVHPNACIITHLWWLNYYTINYNNYNNKWSLLQGAAGKKIS